MASKKIGFIGLGEHQFRAHIKHLISLAPSMGFSFGSAFDPSDVSFDLAQEKIPSLKRALSAKEVAAHNDVIFISSPDKFHGEHLQLCMMENVHVFCEKPMAVSLEDVEILNAVLHHASNAGLKISTCHPRRFDPPFVELKRKLQELIHIYGDPIGFDFSFWYSEVTDEWKKDRSLLSDHFGHEIDLFCFLFGSGEISATKIHDSFDRYEVTGGMVNGPSFKFSGNRTLDQGKYLESCRIDFRKGAVTILANTGEGWSMPEMEKVWYPKMDYDVRFMATNRDFLSSINGSNGYLTHEDILRNNFLSVHLTEYGKAIWTP